MRSVLTHLILLGLGACDSTDAPEIDETRKIDAEADALLRRMSTSLANTKSFQVDADHALEVVTKDGEMLQFVSESRVSVQRPNKMRSERLGPVADVTMYYDGQQITLAGHRTGLFARAAAPETLDAMLDFSRDRLGLEAPAGDLLYKNAYAGLMEDVVSARYLGVEPVGDAMCHHLAFRAKETDWQIWIEDLPRALPCRYVIRSKKVSGTPSYAVTLTRWKVPSDVDESAFAFTPGPDATQTQFVSLARTTNVMKGNRR